MSHIQDVIDKVDTKTMILYNRALVTMGLSAFRRGLVQKAHDCLSGICSGRVRELLAQGQARWPEKDPEQEKVRSWFDFQMFICSNIQTNVKILYMQATVCDMHYYVYLTLL